MAEKLLITIMTLMILVEASLLITIHQLKKEVIKLTQELEQMIKKMFTKKETTEQPTKKWYQKIF